MKKQRRKRQLKAISAIFFIFLALALTQISFISAWDFDNSKKFSEEGRYGKVEIINAFGLGSKLAEYTLLENTDSCLTNCYAEGEAILYEEDSLFRSLRFENKAQREVNLQRAKIFIQKNVSYEVRIPEIEFSCEGSGNSTVCEEIEVGSHLETRYKLVWEEYNHNLLKGSEEGIKYLWRIEGTKKLSGSVDWIAGSYGVEFTEWAWWNNDWVNCKDIEQQTAITGNNQIMVFNLTGLVFSNITEVRIVNESCNDGGVEVKSTVLSNGSDWAHTTWLANLSGATLNYSVYYNNPTNPVKDELVDAYCEMDNNCSWIPSTGSTPSMTFVGGIVSIENSGWFNSPNVIGQKNFVVKYNFTNSGGNPGTFGTLMNGTAAPTSLEDGVALAGLWGHTTSDRIVGTDGVPAAQADSLTTADRNLWRWAFAKVNTTTLNLTLWSTSAILGEGQTVKGITIDSLRLGFGSTASVAVTGRTIDYIRSYDLESEFVTNDSMPTFVLGAEEIPPLVETELLFPLNDSNISTSNVTFEVNSTPTLGENLSNVTLYVWNSSDDNIIKNFTALSGNTSINTSWDILGFIDDNYTWNAQSGGEDGSISFDLLNRTFKIDTTGPGIILTSPNQTFPIIRLADNISLNWSVTDPHLESCWYNYDGTNISVICADNNVSFRPNSAKRNITFYANDSFGNEANNLTSWDFNLFENSITFLATVTEGQQSDFTINLSSDGNQIVTSNLSYEGSESTTSKTGNNLEMTFTKALRPSEGTNSFFFNISYGGTFFNSTNSTQEVVDLNITECALDKTTLFNFSIVDEATQIPINTSSFNTTIEIDFNILFPNGTVFKSFSANKTTNNFSICVENDSLNEIPFFVSSLIKYDADDYEAEFYNIQNYSLTNTTANQNITLYDLLTTDSQVFELIVRDNAFLPLGDALIEVKRKYISEGLFKIVELPKTDESGETVAHLVLNDVIYTFNIVKFGEVIVTFNDVRATCATPALTTCIIDFTAFAGTIEVPDFEAREDFNFTLGYDSATRTVSSTFLIPSGETSTIILNVTREDALGTSVCTDTLTSTSGTISCVVASTFGNATVRADLFKDGVFQSTGNIKIDENPSDIYQGVVVVLSLFVMLSLIGAASSPNPIVTVFSLLMGVVVLFALNLVANNGFIGATATILWLFIAIIIVAVKGGKRT